MGASSFRQTVCTNSVPPAWKCENRSKDGSSRALRAPRAPRAPHQEHPAHLHRAHPAHLRAPRAPAPSAPSALESTWAPCTERTQGTWSTQSTWFVMLPPMSLLERQFRLSENGTSVRVEVLAGFTTFLTMAYIIFVQPAVLGAAGMDFGAVLMATCLASGLATIAMGLFANYPIALAPAMGHNFFFAYTVVIGMHVPWQVALGAVAIAGTMTALLVGLRTQLMVAIPPALKRAIAVGIGLLIAMVGLQWGGIIVAAPGTM